MKTPDEIALIEAEQCRLIWDAIKRERWKQAAKERDRSRATTRYHHHTSIHKSITYAELKERMKEPAA